MVENELLEMMANILYNDNETHPYLIEERLIVVGAIIFS